MYHFIPYIPNGNKFYLILLALFKKLGVRFKSWKEKTANLELMRSLGSDTNQIVL